MRSKKEGFMGERQVKLSPMVVNIEEHDPLTASLYITDIGYYPKAENHHVKRSEGIMRMVYYRRKEIRGETKPVFHSSEE